MLSKLRYALASLLHRERMNRALDDEIAHHIELETRKNMASGMSPDAARRQARLAFGAVQDLREAHRDGRGTRWLSDFGADARHACRTLWRTPALAPQVRSAVRELDPQLAIQRIETMSAVRAVSMARDRFVMSLVAMFGILGVVLAVVGVYGVLAELARERMREMGIRIALGARSRAVQWLIVRHGLLFGSAGVGLGVVLALAGTRGLSRLLFGITPLDAATFAVVAPALLAATLVASWLPAWRSGRVDPIAILREE